LFFDSAVFGLESFLSYAFGQNSCKLISGQLFLCGLCFI
jgi:hypothetical protein